MPLPFSSLTGPCLYLCTSMGTVVWALLYLATPLVIDVCNNLIVSDKNVPAMRPNKVHLTI